MSLASLQGLAGSIPGASALTGTMGAPAAPADPAAAGQTAAKGLFSSGVNLPWWANVFLTGIAPLMILIPYVGPTLFSLPYTFGSYGINLLASNSMGWAAAKAASQLACSLLADLLQVKFGGRWWAPPVRAILKYANPWFVFDILQVWNPNFVKEGYKIPFWNKQTNSTLEGNKLRTERDIGWPVISKLDSKSQPLTYQNDEGKPIAYAVNSTGKPTFNGKLLNNPGPVNLDATMLPFVNYGWMGAIAFGACIVLILPALYTMAEAFPPEIQAKMVPVLNTVFTLGGAVTAIAGGGLGTFVLLPKLGSILQTNMTSILAGGGAEPQTGGGKKDIPSVEDVAQRLLGGKADNESTFFMGTLAVIVLGGFSLALVRIKNLSATTV